MTKAPERIWAAVDSLYPEQDGGTWVSEICSGVEYTRTDHALALVAAAYEDAENVADEWDDFDYSDGSATARNIKKEIRARTPDDATAALKARDARIRNEALREVLRLARQKYVALGGYGFCDYISALITEGQSDG